MIEDILLRVNKPARYIGQEWNVAKNDFDKSFIKFALCFADLYEVGMSNLGIRIIYGILNNLQDTCCERFFSPDFDMENILRSNHLEIFSLESKKRLRESDIIGFSLGHELNYTNVLNILDLGKIPLRAHLRNQEYPLVIAGGPCVLNPEPLHEFFDLFVFGEAEEVILEIIDIYRKRKVAFKSSRISKQDLLVEFAQLEGVYAPSLYEVVYNGKARIEEFKPKICGIPAKIKKRVVKDLDKMFSPLNWLVPYIEIVHDRITLEIMRGCPNKCRFCQARSQYFPFRQRSPENILNLAHSIYKHTGYEEISLGGLSVSDYSGLERLLKSLINIFKEKAVSVSLPSLKPKTIVGNLSSLIASIKKTGLTFAPEAGTERMRKILGKDFAVQDFFKVVEEAYSSGYQRIKLYFLIGLPFEELKDIDSIIEFSKQTSNLRKKFNKNAGLIQVSINTLIPKPHTPFQWLGMQSIEAIQDKQTYLKNRAKNSRLVLSFHNRYMSILEAILCRGDRRLSQVIFLAFKKGARFDAWENHFNFNYWIDAFKESGLSPDFYLQPKTKDEILPWDFLDTGISKELLFADSNKLVAIE